MEIMWSSMKNGSKQTIKTNYVLIAKRKTIWGKVEEYLAENDFSYIIKKNLNVMKSNE